MQLYREIAAKRPGIITKVGLGTFIDPRQRDGKMNAVTTKDYVSLLELDGEEYLFYRSFPIDVALIRGTTADTKTATSRGRGAAPVRASAARAGSSQ